MCSACCGGASGRTFPSRGCDGCPAPRAGGLLTQCVRYRPCLGAWSCRGPSQVETCHVVSRPYPGRGSRLSLRESPDAKSPREGRVSPLPGPTSLWFEKLGEVGFSFSYKLWTDARNGPPPGWAGWGKWGGIGRKGLWVPLPKAFPLGGRWPGAAGTDEGATGYPTEQKKTGVQAAGRWALVFYKERLRSHRPLISLLRRQLPPK